MNNVQIYFGALCPKITKQLSSQGLKFKNPADAKWFQKAADGITFLSIHSYLSDAEKVKARKRLIVKISKAVCEK